VAGLGGGGGGVGGGGGGGGGGSPLHWKNWCIKKVSDIRFISFRESCNTLQHSATLCTLQHSATHCNTLFQEGRKFVSFLLKQTATHSNKLQQTATQHTATHCNTLQPTATRCNTLQHTTTHCIKKFGHSCRLF